MTDVEHLRGRPAPTPSGLVPDAPSPATTPAEPSALPLERLVTLYRPTPEQAALLAADVLDALARPAHPAVGPLEETIRVGRDGHAHWCPGPDARAGARAALAGLVEACGDDEPSGVRPDPVLAASQALADPAVDPRHLADGLRLGGEPDAVARRRLGAVVTHATGGATSPLSARPPRTGAPVRTRIGPPTGRRPWSWRRAGATAWRRSWPWLLALTVLVAVVGAEIALLSGRISRDLASLQAAGAPTTPTTTAPAPTGVPAGPVPAPGPPAAGPVAGVDLRAVPPPCTPGDRCPVRLLVRLGAPAPEVSPPIAVAWHLEVVDRCTGARAVVPGDRVQVPVGAGEGYGLAAPVLPPGRALALVPVVDAPARAAGAPLLVGGTTC